MTVCVYEVLALIYTQEGSQQMILCLSRNLKLSVLAMLQTLGVPGLCMPFLHTAGEIGTHVHAELWHRDQMPVLLLTQ